MTRYLLGDLPETEEAAVEQEYFADPEKLEEVWAAENDLVDRYLRGRLSRGERELFERNYLRSPKHRERVSVARKLIEAADWPLEENSVTPQVIESVSFWRNWRDRLTGALNKPKILMVSFAAAAILLLFGGSAWLLLERARLMQELGKTSAELSERQRREREIADQLAAEREQSGKLKSEIDRLQETIAQKTTQTPDQPARPSIFSFFLAPLLATRTEGASQQQFTISPDIDLVRLQMKIEPGDTRSFQVAIRMVGEAEVWNQRPIDPRSNAITVNVPANKLPLGDYILTLSAMTPTGEQEEINRYSFRVLRK